MQKDKIVSSAQKALCWAQNAAKAKFRKYSEPVQKNPAAQAGKPKIIQMDREAPESKKRYNSGWKELGEKKCYFRSKWESNYGCYLEWQKGKGMIKEWEHEPQTFWFDGIKRGCVSYLPDFKVTHNDGRVEWIEVKGYMDSKSKTKINRFKKYYPKENLKIIDSSWYRNNKNKLCFIVPQWDGK